MEFETNSFAVCSRLAVVACVVRLAASSILAVSCFHVSLLLLLLLAVVVVVAVAVAVTVAVAVPLSASKEPTDWRTLRRVAVPFTVVSSTPIGVATCCRSSLEVM